MHSLEARSGNDPLAADQITQYRRDGFVVVRRLLSRPLVDACLAALTDLASGKQATAQAGVIYEPGHDATGVAAEARIDRVRKFTDFVEDFPALKRVAMLRKLHDVLDGLLGPGRVLFQEMALVKPPRIGSVKPWHQDASYFRVNDPAMIAGVWIALDPATRENGCMEMVPGSHLGGPAIHEPQPDANMCNIRADQVHPERRVAIEMEPGDALIFSSLVHHYTAPNTSGLRRRAVQFHYHQLGMEWMSLEHHRQQFHDEKGEYAGCTVPKPGGPVFNYRGPLTREIVPMEDIA
jgi:phytanoyl-CoA hydroxylase